MSSRGLKDLLTFEKGGQMGTEPQRKKQVAFTSGEPKKTYCFFLYRRKLGERRGGKKGTSKEVRKK
jgi:hypothetical protein